MGPDLGEEGQNLLLLLVANLHPSPACVRAHWPAGLPSGGGLEPNAAPNKPRVLGQRGPETEPKQAQNGPKIAQVCPVTFPKRLG